MHPDVGNRLGGFQGPLQLRELFFRASLARVSAITAKAVHKPPQRPDVVRVGAVDGWLCHAEVCAIPAVQDTRRRV